MGPKATRVHLIIGFGLLFLVPITSHFNDDLGDLASRLAILYWGAVACVFFFITLRAGIKSEGFWGLIFKTWVVLSGVAGLCAAYFILMEGLNHTPVWVYVLFIYGGGVAYLFRDAL